jgi:hypothetical protein
MSKAAYDKIAYISYGKNKGKYLSKEKVLKLINETSGILGTVVSVEFI